ncbi:MAG: glutamate--tRNA ligase family protein [Vicinamibacterales bacterium]
MRGLDVAALADRLPPSPRTRYAPSPTGYLHLGHVANAIVVWGLARQLGGRVLLRLETHDRGRCRPAYRDAIVEDLAWLGFEPDEGPVDQDDPRPYADAVETLRGAGLTYACACSRRERMATPDRGGGCTGRCRERGLGDGPGRTLRLRVDPRPEPFVGADGAWTTGDAAAGGDIVLRDRAGLWSYHLAVTVDDLRQQIDLVIRGDDLVEATGVQVQLARHLGRVTPPVFVHHGLVTGPDGRKLSKSHRDAGVREWRAGGASPAEVIGRAAAGAGLAGAPRALPARDVARLFERRAAGAPEPGARVLG